MSLWRDVHSPVARWLVTNVTEEFHRSFGRRRSSLIFGVVVRHDLWLQLPPLNLRKDVRKAHPMLWDTRLLMPLPRRPLKSRKSVGNTVWKGSLPVFRDLRGRHRRSISRHVSRSMEWAFLLLMRQCCQLHNHSWQPWFWRNNTYSTTAVFEVISRLDWGSSCMLRGLVSVLTLF